MTAPLISNKDTFYFYIREPEPDYMEEDPSEFDDTEIPKHLILYMRTEPIDKQIVVATTNYGYDLPYCEMTYRPLEQVISYDGDENASSVGNGEAADENSDELIGTVKSSCIGEHIYIAAGYREVMYRTDVNVWKKLGNNDTYDDREVYYEEEENANVEDGFDDVDGFDESHIYAVGGKGDVWRCIDNQWIQCDFPTNLRLSNVCCAGDGNVYISGIQGITYYGKEDNWTKVEGDELSLSFTDMVWHDGKVWCTSDYGLWCIEDGKLEKADVPDFVFSVSGSLCARFGMLLVAGLNGAALHENGKWISLI